MPALLSMIMASASAMAGQVQVVMRDTGYTLGDIIEAHVELPAGTGSDLDAASLPQPGRLAPWLDLRAVALHGDRIDFEWQVFATVETAQALQLPPLVLKLKGGTQNLALPGRSFQLSPVLPTPLQDSAPRPTPTPPTFDESGPLRGAAGFGLLALLLVVTWLWLVDRLPGWPRDPGPFTQLSRALRRMPTAADAVLDLTVLRRVHQALNNAAGQTLYPETLPLLFHKAPAAAAERAQIEAFFAASWTRFFGDASAPLDAAALRAWVERAARVERLQR